jgi:cobalt-precorrin 5A hydrolase/precorrin-3B C17-methyltransferase
VIGLIAVTAAGRTAADRLAESWPGRTRRYPAPAGQALSRAWTECDELVCFLAVGATVRIIAPLLQDKRTDPAVVCVDESARCAVAVVGGHAAGANALAMGVADVLGAQPVVTTATDTAGLPGLDLLGWPAEGALGAVSRAMLDGDPVALESAETWPLPPLPPNVVRARPGAGPRPARHCILITDELVAPPPRTVVLRPPSLAVGVGASRGVTAEEILGLVDAVLAEAGVSPHCVAAMATLDAKACEPGIVSAARRRGWPVLSYPAGRLAEIAVPHPSAEVAAAVGTPSVSEAAALASGGQLVIAKRKTRNATAALARIRPRGRLTLIGLGPGARDLLAPRAVAELRRASVVVGLDSYVATIRDLVRSGTQVLTSKLGAEQERAAAAVQHAKQGHAVALVGSGDAGVYAMASPALSLAGADIEVSVVPGVTASLAASALLGAPLGHDHAIISLSDLHTPWEIIERRVAAAAAGDFVVAFYNPRSTGRDWQLGAALAILAKHRPPETPAGIVRNAARPGEQVVLTTVAGLDPVTEDMSSIVIVGATTTQVVAGRMITPRGV